jgi:hypothetical protein
MVCSGKISRLFGNEIGNATEEKLDAALEEKPTPEVLAEQAQVKDRLLWQTFMWRPTSVCCQLLGRPHSQLAVHTVLCVDARLYFQETEPLCYIPTELWYGILSFLRTIELGVIDIV